MNLFRITKVLLNYKKTYLINLLEYKNICINIQLNKTSCEIDKFFLNYEKNKINDIQNKLTIGILNDKQIDEIINDLHKSYNNKI